MPVVSTGRTHLSEVVKGVSDIQSNQGINFHYAPVDVEGSGDVDPIGLLLKWSNADSAFKPLAPNAARVDSTAYALGDVVRPATHNGLEYVAIAAGTSDASEPTMPTIAGATVADGTVTWLARMPYGADQTSPLANKASICIAVGSKEGLGFNKEDVTLSATAVKMTAMFRGIGGVVEDLLKDSSGLFSAMAADDQAEIKAALEMQDIAVESAAQDADGSYVS